MGRPLDRQTIESYYLEFKTPAPVIRHCAAVAEAGVTIGRALNEAQVAKLDLDLIEKAGLVHDVMRVFDDHDLAAGAMLRERGYQEVAALVEHHMRYQFGDPGQVSEIDVLCLADRLVKENLYVGIDERIEYLIHKPGENPQRTEHLLQAKERIKEYMRALEAAMGRTIDGLFLHADAEVVAKLGPLLKRVEKPARYIGSETNMAFRQTREKLRFAFGFPDLYEIGMSYLGLQILYHLLNKMPDVYCERVFTPAEDMARLMRENDLPLFTLETKTPLSRMDVVGFTLQYEMSYTNILYMLDLSGIPLRASERSEEDPLVIAGGPCAYNPEPLADFIDVFLIGDGEETLPAFLSAYAEAKKQGLTKETFLRQQAGITGVYVPAAYEARYREDGRLLSCDPVWPEAPRRVERALIDDLEKIPFPTEPIVPFIETVHDRAVVETFRGCTRGCRFCQAGMIYRPVRERSTDTIIDLATRQLAATGHDELSLLSLSTSDYSDFENMATRLMKQCAQANIALSLPSLRLDSFSFQVLQEIQKYRKSGLTFAPEAGTQRLRDVINKGITEEDIFGATEQAVQLGWNHIKLYFMIGLPTETYEDLDGIASIARRIMEIHRRCGRGGRFNVTVSVSNFVPKPHTPFQWAAQDTAESFRAKHDYLRSILKIKGVTFAYHDDETSVLEAILARGDRRVGEILLRAYRNGCHMDSWSEFFNADGWKTAIAESGVDTGLFTVTERGTDELMPWHHIDASLTDAFLIREWEKAHQEETTPDCRLSCNGCGINRRTVCRWGGVR